MEKVFIFDMDGVILNSEPMHHMVELEVAKEYGIPLDLARLQSYIGMRTRDVWELLIKEEDLSLDAEDLLVLGLNKKINFIKQSELQPINGILELLDELKGLDYTIALASSSPKILIDTILKKFKVDSFFNCIVSGDEVKKGKPAPDIYLEVTKRLMVSPWDCLVLEDSKMGIESANMAGMKTIGFINPGSGNQDLSKANHIINSINQTSLLLR